jgi:O-antigen/teichoic acid export membrane protein
MSLTHALKWSFLSELASKAISPIVFVVLARLLTPEDFGVMSSALMVMSFSQIFWEAGMGKALIQRQTDHDEAANIAFWINIALGIVIACVLFFAAHPIAITFFHDDRVTVVIQVMTAQVLFGAISSVHTALLQKEMGFKKLFWVRFATVSFPGMVSIPLAWNGMGYWALVFGTLLGQAVQVIMLWKMSSWRPKFSFEIQVAKELTLFGAWVGVSGVLAWFYAWADSLIVGMFLGGHDLGIYRLGSLLVTSIFSIIAGPLIPVVYSHLCKEVSKLKINWESVSEKINTGERVMALIFFLFAGSLLLLGDVLLPKVVGDKWKNLHEIIGLLSLANAIACTVSLKQEAYRVIGRSDIETKIMFISMIVRLPFYLFFIKYGMVAFLVGRILSTMIGVINHLYFAKRILNMGPGIYFKSFYKIYLCTVCMLIYYFAIEFDLIVISSKGLGAVYCLSIYLLALIYFEQNTVRRIFSLAFGR